MAQQFTQSSASSSSSVMEKSTTTIGNGSKSSEERIADGRKWKQNMLARGFQETPDGLLPMTEVKKAGFVLQDGKWMIPACEYIADGNSDRQAGEKYVGATRQYLGWRKQRAFVYMANQTKKEAPKLDLKEAPAVVKPANSEGINIDLIPF